MKLVLNNNKIYNGISFGANKNVTGELVFQTGMTGYIKSLTDPSYKGQILVLSYPLIGNYGVPNTIDSTENLNGKIMVSGLVIADYSHNFSHWNANISLSKWLKDNDIPAIYNVDTRAIIKELREYGTMSAKLCNNDTYDEKYDTRRHLVDEVSTQTVKELGNGKYKVVVIDCGIKTNQIRYLLKYDYTLYIVPYNYNFLDMEYDAIFVSNGPGDPERCTETIMYLKTALTQSKPIFGICLGHQLMSIALGCKTYKMTYGNRGYNQPCINTITNKCYMTSQNHGYAVDISKLPNDWCEYFRNLNDDTNEGIICKNKPFFSVQFHPEGKGGPEDTNYLFDQFYDYIQGNMDNDIRVKTDHYCLETVKKVLILGSGGLSIGQAGEFDYSGSQAIKSMKEEGIETILINPNIATIQTSKDLADKVYFLPVTPEFVHKIILKEKPDSILVQFGGQTALNCAIDLYNDNLLSDVKILGTPIQTIINTEDRDIFKHEMIKINECTAPSVAVTDVESGINAGKQLGYPLILRSGFALGGLGSNFVRNKEELISGLMMALANTKQVLIEKSLKGWKEVEYEVVRDKYDNCITVCNMENLDPLGIHTGESVVVAPSQTLNNDEYFMLRDVSIRVIRHLGVIGECNIQFALDPTSDQYYIIEVNARLSRSSALASKATGYPLAFVASKLSLGYPLYKLKNKVTGVTTAFFEPSLDYVTVKIPRWDLSKFNNVEETIGTSMKSVGEAMSIGRTFEEAIQKALRMINDVDGFEPLGLMDNIDQLSMDDTNYRRIFMLADGLKNYSVKEINEISGIDNWFLYKLKGLVDWEITKDNILGSKQLGFSDKQIAKVLNTTELQIRTLRKQMGILPFIKQIDTLSAEFPAVCNYLYMTYNATEHDIKPDTNEIIVLGSGTYRIGSSVEFDWCAVNAIDKLNQMGYKTVMINYNPETVSTDYDVCDKLYFEEISFERVSDIYEFEQPNGVIVSMGGQGPNNIAKRLSRNNVKILGSSPDIIDNAENRYKFSRMCDRLGIDQPKWKICKNIDDCMQFCNTVDYPCLVRPSFVLSGAGMVVINTNEELKNYLAGVDMANNNIVISKFIENAKELDIDAIGKNGKVVISAIMEHIENAGTHSGDASLLFPPINLDENMREKVNNITAKICEGLCITGSFNIQYILTKDSIKVIECNLRSSRSLPFISKTTGINFAHLAIETIMSNDITYKESYNNIYDIGYIGIKVPQFSFNRLKGSDPVLGVEMASTGEVASFGHTYTQAYLKAYLSSTMKLPKKNILVSIGPYKDKVCFMEYANKLVNMGYNLYCTPGTADYLSENNVYVKQLQWSDESDEMIHKLESQEIDFVILVPSKNKYRRANDFVSKGYKVRRLVTDLAIPLITNTQSAKLLVDSLAERDNLIIDDIDCLNYVKKHDINETYTFYKKNMISVSDFSSRDQLHVLFNTAQDIETKLMNSEVLDTLKGKILTNVFWEPSTRTASSFAAAIIKLGGNVLPFNIEHSSTAKGETFMDTLKTLECYSDVLVVRHPDQNFINKAGSLCKKPIINAGNGSGEHPTQALLDVYTIRKELGTVNDLTVTFVGDLKNGRTVHSLVKLLNLYNTKLVFVSHPDLTMPKSILDNLVVPYKETSDLDSVLPDTDVLYVTRLQKERGEYRGNYYKITPNILNKAKEDMIIMHPLPRVDEISRDVDNDPRAVYFRQMENGLYVRMALLSLILTK